MKLKNTLIVVRDMERARRFYQELFGLSLFQDNMILSEGVVLQDAVPRSAFFGRQIYPQSNSCELFFEESELDPFVQKLEQLYPDVNYVNRMMTHSWGQRVVRFYDPDGNLIEVGTPMPAQGEAEA